MCIKPGLAGPPKKVQAARFRLEDVSGMNSALDLHVACQAATENVVWWPTSGRYAARLPPACRERPLVLVVAVSFPAGQWAWSAPVQA
jgi:hypothetical protein